MQTSTLKVTNAQGMPIVVDMYVPDSEPRGVVQVAHGASEHAQRYVRFCTALANAGYIVYANDHRGHGRTAGTLDKAGIVSEDSWNGMAQDLKLLTDTFHAKHPNLPYFLFGHSMGSFLGQQYIQTPTWADQLAGVILCGTTSSFGEGTDAMIAGVEQETVQNGPNAPSVNFMQMFGSFNQPFEPVKTGFEWLSRDEAEVQKYVDDPWSGFAFSNQIVGDMLRGCRDVWSEGREKSIPTNLPILIVAGAMDPVSNFGGEIRKLADRYTAHGIKDLTVHLYEGARHEVLNETNRDEVTQDVINWLNEHTSK